MLYARKFQLTWTTGELKSWARASNILTLVLRCWPEPIPPTYLCRHPRARELPVLLTTSRADFNLKRYKIHVTWAATWDFQPCGMCNQQRLRSACTYVQSDQSLCLALESSMNIKLLTEHYLEFLSLKGGCTGSSESSLVKMPHCWKSHVTAHIIMPCFG